MLPRPRSVGQLGYAARAVSSGPHHEPVSRAYAGYVLGVLVVVYVFNFVDRYILSVLLQPIKEDLGVSDTAMGFLTGFAFAIFYTVAGIPIARWADRGTRRTIVALGLGVWSAMTALSGLAQSFWQLALARVGVGVGEASASPASHSMISDLFPAERRGRALGIYTMGANIGILFGAWLGGWLNELFGWRAAFLIVGLPGLALAGLVRWTLREPLRGHADGVVVGADVPEVSDVARHLWSRPAFRQLSIAAGLYAFAGYAFLIWGPTFLIRVHGMGTAEVGFWFGIVAGLGGALGAYLGGALSDRLGGRDVRWAMRVPVIGGLLSIPPAAGFLFASSASVALSCYFVMIVVGAFYIGPTYAMTQGLAAPRMRALATAVILFVLNLIGLGLGPQTVGILNDVLHASHGDDAIRISMAGVWLVNLWAAVHSLRAARTLRADLDASAAAA